jgi:hypothetical protein
MRGSGFSERKMKKISDFASIFRGVFGFGFFVGHLLHFGCLLNLIAF